MASTMDVGTMIEAFEKTSEILLEEISVVLPGATRAGYSQQAIPETDEETVLASIGFGGDDLRGSVLLVGATSVWREIGSTGFSADMLVNAQLCDVAGEVCNMLLGRFRKRLLRVGIDVACGTPTSTYGHLVVPRLPAASALHVGAQRLELAAGPIFMRADVLFRDAFVFPTATAMGVEPAETDLFF